MKLPFHHSASNRIFKNARALKRTQTGAEKVLWKLLRDRRFQDHKFRRQHPVASYIVDFYCHRSNLVVEVDGQIHNNPDRIAYDEERTKVLTSLGLKVIRFTNEEVFSDVAIVLAKIEQNLFSILRDERGSPLSRK